MSLDSPEKKLDSVDDDHFYVFHLLNPETGSEVKMRLTTEEMKTMATYGNNSLDVPASSKKRSYFNMLCEQIPLKGNDFHIDFNNPEVRVTKKSFKFITDILLGDTIPILRSDLNCGEVRLLADYLGVTELVPGLFPPKFEDAITEEDRTMRNYEIEVRKILYQEEETNHTAYDDQLVFHKVMASLSLDTMPGSGKPPLLRADITEEEAYSLFANQYQLDDGTHNRRIELATQYLAEHKSLSKEPFWGLFTPDPTTVQDRFDLSPQPASQVIPYTHIGTGVPGKLLSIACDRVSYINDYFREYLGCEFLDGEDWGPFVIAGGAITSLLTGMGVQGASPVPYRRPGMWKTRPLFHNTKERLIKDIDLNLITRDRNEADRACQRLLAWCQKVSGFIETVAVATDQSFTITMRSYGIDVKFQVILRLYNSISQVITGFDIDSCTAAWDGKRVYCTQRYIRALQTGYNIADPERQSTTYAYRLIKYLQRGFGIAMPGLELPIRKVSTTESTGVMRIIDRWTHFSKFVNDAYASKRGGYGNENSGEFITDPSIGDYAIDEVTPQHEQHQSEASQPEVNSGSTEVSVSEQPPKSDYETYFRRTYTEDIMDFIGKDTDHLGEHEFMLRLLEAGENYDFNYEGETIEGIRRRLSFIPKSFVSNFQYYTSPEELLERDTPEWHPTALHPRRLPYRTKNPAGQTTNSFKPLNEEWYDSLYVVNLEKEKAMSQDAIIWKPRDLRY